jgi:hypothetical protein
MHVPYSFTTDEMLRNLKSSDNEVSNGACNKINQWVQRGPQNLRQMVQIIQCHPKMQSNYSITI